MFESKAMNEVNKIKKLLYWVMKKYRKQEIQKVSQNYKNFKFILQNY